MPFGVVNGVSQWMGVLNVVVIIEREGQFCGWIWSVPLLPMGTFFRICARATHSSQITLGGLVSTPIAVWIMEYIVHCSGMHRLPILDINVNGLSSCWKQRIH